MPFRIRNAIGVLAIAVLSCVSLLGVGCGGGDGAERAVEWGVDRPLGPKRVRLIASVEVCNLDLPLLEEPIIEYTGSKHVEIELRQTPEELEEGQNGCLLRLLGAYKTITLERDLDELVLFDASSDPPEQRWPTKSPLPTE